MALGLLLLLVLWTVLAPSESRLGNVIKVVYVHGALVWAGLLTFSLAGVLGAGLGNGLGLALWWQAGQHIQPGVSQLCWWPLVVAAIGPLVSYVTLMLVKGPYLVPAIRVLSLQLLNRMLFFLTVSLLTIGFYLGWTDGGGVTLLGAALFVPYVLLAPLVIGTYLIRDAPGSAR